ncbi:phytanoyl-CoA dioxygenase family protein [Edaphobacter albus]|uniref:hypothetical protein n=1 Tax=Edaphobacter sp. 4G125 TaxID=2763071 RepID=UPI001649330B|nr:hypothetical protein [Edaphobacter sp. 4G125]QNI37810.1 hypothetical protein H7846_05905 [Edaphobacter sp. 4G125]
MPELSLVERRIVLELKNEGVSVTSLAELAIDGTTEMVIAGTEISRALSTLAKRPDHFSGRKAVSADIASTASYRAIFNWGLNLSLLRIVEGYLDLPPAYDGPKVAYTPADGRQAGTRLWHRDREDRRMLKAAIYLTDVPESGGPLQCLKSQIFDGPIDREFSYPVLSHEELEQKLKRKIAEEDITSCTGPAGTIVFMDTARLFHRGKPAVSVDRRAIFHSYFSRNPRHPFFCERSDLSRGELEQFAAGMSPIQRDAVLWRNYLPSLARIVPASVT